MVINMSDPQKNDASAGSEPFVPCYNKKKSLANPLGGRYWSLDLFDCFGQEPSSLDNPFSLTFGSCRPMSMWDKFFHVVIVQVA